MYFLYINSVSVSCLQLSGTAHVDCALSVCSVDLYTEFLTAGISEIRSLSFADISEHFWQLLCHSDEHEHQ